jgi:hypothetical protein
VIDSVPSAVLAAVGHHREPVRPRQWDPLSALRDHLVVTATATLGALASLGEGPGAVIDYDELTRQVQIATQSLRAAEALSSKGPHICSR